MELQGGYRGLRRQCSLSRFCVWSLSTIKGVGREGMESGYFATLDAICKSADILDCLSWPECHFAKRLNAWPEHHYSGEAVIAGDIGVLTDELVSHGEPIFTSAISLRFCVNGDALYYWPDAQAMRTATALYARNRTLQRFAESAACRLRQRMSLHFRGFYRQRKQRPHHDASRRRRDYAAALLAEALSCCARADTGQMRWHLQLLTAQALQSRNELMK